MKQNFDRFTSCKTTIDDIYTKLQRVESAGAGASAAVLFSAVQEAQGAAKRAFGPLLERHAKAERIKSVQVGAAQQGAHACCPAWGSSHSLVLPTHLVANRAPAGASVACALCLAPDLTTEPPRAR